MMKFLRKIRAWWRNLFRKRRFNMLNATDNSEEWHIHLSPASILAGLTAFALLCFVLVLSLMAYTPVLEFLPGYRTEADRMRESLVQNIIRLDSMERMMNDMMTYNENIALVLEGRTPASRSYLGSDSLRTDRKPVLPSHADSLLRAEMEGDGPYSLSGNGSRREIRQAMELVTPVEGIVAEHFDIGENRFGVRVAAAAGGRITAIDNGTVIQSQWTPENRYIIMIQHADNLVSVYKNLSQSLVSLGQTVHGGDQLGYNLDPETEGAESGEGAELFEFELWSNGKPVDPEGYIVF